MDHKLTLLYIKLIKNREGRVEQMFNAKLKIAEIACVVCPIESSLSIIQKFRENIHQVPAATQRVNRTLF
jgi:hypothetical protein